MFPSRTDSSVPVVVVVDVAVVLCFEAVVAEKDVTMWDSLGLQLPYSTMVLVLEHEGSIDDLH